MEDSPEDLKHTAISLPPPTSLSVLFFFSLQPLLVTSRMPALPLLLSPSIRLLLVALYPPLYTSISLYVWGGSTSSLRDGYVCGLRVCFRLFICLLSSSLLSSFVLLSSSPSSLLQRSLLSTLQSLRLVRLLGFFFLFVLSAATSSSTLLQRKVLIRIASFLL